MVSVVWRNIPTVLSVEELLDKAFTKAKKAGDAVVDKDRIYRTRKQMIRMIGSAGDTLSATLLDWVRRWPSIDKMSEFDVAMVEAARSVGASAKFAGSGGAIVGHCHDDAMCERLQQVLAPLGCQVITPTIAASDETG